MRWLRVNMNTTGQGRCIKRVASCSRRAAFAGKQWGGRTDDAQITSVWIFTRTFCPQKVINTSHFSWVTHKNRGGGTCRHQVEACRCSAAANHFSKKKSNHIQWYSSEPYYVCRLFIVCKLISHKIPVKVLSWFAEQKEASQISLFWSVS